MLARFEYGICLFTRELWMQLVFIVLKVVVCIMHSNLNRFPVHIVFSDFSPILLAFCL